MIVGVLFPMKLKGYIRKSQTCLLLRTKSMKVKHFPI